MLDANRVAFLLARSVWLPSKPTFPNPENALSVAR
jgi:hypothetical protein